MNTDGWIKLHRILVEHPISKQLPLATFKVWIMCLMRANRKPTKWYDGHSQIDIPEGAFVFSQDSLSEFCGVSRKQIRTSLEHLKNLHCVAITGATRYSLLVIENWAAYQSNESVEGQMEGNERAGKGPDEGQMRATEEEVRSKKKEYIQKRNGRKSDDASEWKAVLDTVAQKIHDRHPVIHRCGISEIKNQLTSIVSKLHDPGRIEKLRKIDANHEAWCRTEKWSTDSGRWANGLAKWLAPTIGRFEDGPPAELDFVSEQKRMMI